MVYQQLLRRILFAAQPERAHEMALSALAAAGRQPAVLASIRRAFAFDDPSLRVEAFGLSFANPAGLAAGFDKNARAVRTLAAFGFGAVEVGGVTAEPRPGNPKPRIQRRLPERALVNWMGLPNEGVDVVARRLATELRGASCRVGLNVAGDRVEGYLKVLRHCALLVDYATLNVSCPNVPANCQLARPEQIRALLAGIQAEPELRRLPTLLKISPDLTDDEVARLVDLAVEGGAAGIVATNTSARMAGARGGLSGAPLRQRSTEVIRQAYRRAGDRLTIIGVGGIFTAEEAFDKILAGATLVQVYTGFIYEGPGIVRAINHGLARLLTDRGFSRVQDAVGAEDNTPLSITPSPHAAPARADAPGAAG